MIRLDQTFEYTLEETVMVTVAGKTLMVVVDVCSIPRHQSHARYYCEWIDAKDSVNGRWFDEAELSHQANQA